MSQIGDDRKNPNVTAEPPGEGADRSIQAAEELAGAPAIFPGLQPVHSPYFREPSHVISEGADGWPEERVPVALLRNPILKEALMSIAAEIDDLELAMRNVLLTTRATAVCPFHQEVTIRIGDDAAETHAFYRARNIVKSDGSRWDHDLLVQEIARQLAAAADRVCPGCLGESPF